MGDWKDMYILLPPQISHYNYFYMAGNFQDHPLGLASIDRTKRLR